MCVKAYFQKRTIFNKYTEYPLEKPLYSCMLNEEGGRELIDDLLTYYVDNGDWTFR